MFCEQFGLAKSASFGEKRFGLEGGKTLAKLWKHWTLLKVVTAVIHCQVLSAQSLGGWVGLPGVLLHGAGCGATLAHTSVARQRLAQEKR
eukprot:311659-Amphidinium_carterae.1